MLYDIKKLFIFDYFISSLINKTGNFFIDVYFKTLMIFAFINLFLSIFSCVNFINFYGDMCLLYIFTFVHTIFCLLYGLFKIGPKKIFFNFYVVREKSLVAILIGILIFNLLVIIDLIIKPIVIATRLLLNVYVGESLHCALSNMNYGIFLIIFLNCFKVFMYVLQAYMFCIFMFSIYQHTCVSHD